MKRRIVTLGVVAVLIVGVTGYLLGRGDSAPTSGSWPDWLITICTFFVVGISAFQAYLVNEQLAVMNKTLDKNAEVTSAELRAYVSVELGSYTIDEGSFAYSFVAKNCGATPAHKAKIFTAWMVAPYPCPSNTAFMESPPPNELRGIGYIFPGQISEGKIFASRQNMGDFTLAVSDLAVSNSVLYLYGGVEYEDIYGIPHKTSFRYVAAHGGVMLAAEGNSAY